jgi:predicted transcriptional regulator
MKPVGELIEKYQNIVLKGFDPVSAGGFTQVPNILLKSKLSANAKVVYAQLLAYAWTNDKCYPGQVRMAEDIGTSQPTITRALQELEDAGWLQIERRGQGKTNIYTLTYVVNNARVVDKVHKSKAVIHG